MARNVKLGKSYNKRLGEAGRRELTPEEERRNQIIADAIPRTELQNRAREQGVPVQAFKDETETKDQFKQRVQSGEKTADEAATRQLTELKRIELEKALLDATPGTTNQQQQGQALQQGQKLEQQQQGTASTSSTNQGEDLLKPNEGALPGLRQAINSVGGIPGRGELPPQNLNPVPGLLGVTAKIADAVRTAFTGKSSKQLAASEEVMNTYMGALAQDIELYRQGAKSFDEVAGNIKQADASITQYETNLVGEGKRNLNFWIDKGARIEANVIVQRDKLNDFKKSLINVGVQR